MKYTIKNIVSLFFFSITMRLARFAYQYMSEESQIEIGSIFTSGLTQLAVDCAYCHCTTVIRNDGVHCVNCGRVYKSHSH